LIRITFW